MRSQPVMSALVDRFEAMGLANFLQYRCDWNETIIRQFYATLDINIVEERLWWTTGKRTYFATFAQFAAANQLDYDFITNDQSVNVVLENPLDENDYPMYYEPANVGIARSFGGIQGLRHHLQSSIRLLESLLCLRVATRTRLEVCTGMSFLM